MNSNVKSDNGFIKKWSKYSTTIGTNDPYAPKKVIKTSIFISTLIIATITTITTITTQPTAPYWWHSPQ